MISIYEYLYMSIDIYELIYILYILFIIYILNIPLNFYIYVYDWMITCVNMDRK